MRHWTNCRHTPAQEEKQRPKIFSQRTLLVKQNGATTTVKMTALMSTLTLKTVIMTIVITKTVLIILSITTK